MRHVCAIEDKLRNHDFHKLSWRKDFRKKFCKYTICSKKNPRTKLYFKSNGAVMFEQKRHLSSKYYYIIHPFSEFRIIWEMWMIFVFGASLIVMPTYVTYFIGSETNDKWRRVQCTIFFLDMACVVDIIVTFYTGYVIEDIKEVVLVHTLIVKKYLCSTYFYIDVLSSFPYALIFSLVNKIYPNYNFEPIKFLNVISLLKIFRLFTLITYLNQVTDWWSVPQNLQAVLECLLLTMLFVHWITCLLYMVPLYIRVISGFEDFTDDSWIAQAKLVGATFSEKYIVSYLRATLFLLCIGRGKYEIRTVEDAIMATICFIIGTMFFGYLFVYLLQLMLSHRVSTTKYQEIMSQLQEYMRHKQLPIKMQWRLQTYYDYKYKKKYFRERNITENLSSRLLREINVHSCRRLVENVSILKDLSEEIISDVISLLKVEVYLPYDTIVKAGTLGDCMYFLASGTVAVLTPTGKEVCHLQDGAYFGEIALIMKDQKRVATVVALEICEIFRLDRKAFRSCFVSNPQLYKEIEERAQTRIERTVILEELRKKFLDEKTKHMSI